MGDSTGPDWIREAESQRERSRRLLIQAYQASLGGRTTGVWRVEAHWTQCWNSFFSLRKQEYTHPGFGPKFPVRPGEEIQVFIDGTRQEWRAQLYAVRDALLKENE